MKRSLLATALISLMAVAQAQTPNSNPAPVTPTAPVAPTIPTVVPTGNSSFSLTSYGVSIDQNAVIKAHNEVGTNYRFNTAYQPTDFAKSYKSFVTEQYEITKGFVTDAKEFVRFYNLEGNKEAINGPVAISLEAALGKGLTAVVESSNNAIGAVRTSLIAEAKTKGVDISDKLNDQGQLVNIHLNTITPDKYLWTSGNSGLITQDQVASK